MTERSFYLPPDPPSLIWAADTLIRLGQTVADEPNANVTHLVLGVPCKATDEELSALLASLPADVTILGGNLNRPLLHSYRCYDLLTDENYLWKNAAITAHNALTLAARQMGVTWDDTNVLILGWGRIGQCLAKYLSALGAHVTVAARKETHRAQISALGYVALDINTLSYQLSRFRVIYNTVPHPILSKQQLSLCKNNCLKIDLASTPGMDGSDVLMARGLPGKYTPETSGRLIAATVLRLCAGEDVP